MGSFKGKIAIVTGAAGGIGTAIAFALAKEGARIAACDLASRRKDGLEPLADVISDIGEAEMAARRHAGVPLGRAGEPEEIARLAILLAGPGGAYITGTAIPVAGGHPVGL